MKNINWKVRMKNKSFWLAIVSAGLKAMLYSIRKYKKEYKNEQT